MSNTPSDAEILALAQEHLKAFAQFVGAGEVWFEGEVEFARAVLAKWGTPQPVVREPLTTLTIAPVRRFLADRGIYLSDETTKALIVVAHGITKERL